MKYQKKKSNFNNITAISYFHSLKHAHMQSKEEEKRNLENKFSNIQTYSLFDQTEDMNQLILMYTSTRAEGRHDNVYIYSNLTNKVIELPSTSFFFSYYASFYGCY
jgi:hypothetical protein